MQFNRIDTPKGRYYQVTHPGGFTHSYKSVTSIIDKLRPSDEFHQWYIKLAKQELGEDTDLSLDQLIEFGHKHSKIINQSVIDTGTQYHEKVENLYKSKLLNITYELDDRLTKLSSFFDSTSLIISESKVAYLEYCNSQGEPANFTYPVGFAGTFDALLRTTNSFIDDDCNEILTTGTKVLVDWKFVKKRKYPRSFYYKQVKYPFMGYSLQLSAYRQALSQMGEKDVDAAMLVVCPEEGKSSYIYLFTKEDLDFYWEYFRKGLLDVTYYNYPPLFSWDDLCQTADKESRLGLRVYAKPA